MTLLTTTSDVSGVLPPEFAALIEEPLADEALAFNPAVATVVRTGSTDLIVPIVREDAGAAWVAEGADIVPDDAVFDQLTITPPKVAGLTKASREILDDSSPSAREILGRGLARSIAAKVDNSFFASLAAPAPGGLESLDTEAITLVESNGFANLDPFAEAIAEMEQAGGTVTSFVTDPDTALAIAQLKDESGSLRPLLGVDATNGTARQVLGVPLFVSRFVTEGTVWALDASANLVVVREGTTLAISADRYFDSDSIAVRATARVGFGFPILSRVVKVAEIPEDPGED